MAQVTLIDGQGQLHTRVYASPADLPTPFLGAFAVVDGGTGGAVYVSLHDLSSTLSWVSWASLLDAIVKLPPVGDPNIIDNVDATVAGLRILSNVGLEVVSGGQVSVHAEQTGSLVEDAAARVERTTFTPGEPLIQVADGSGVSNYVVNGYGEIAVKRYSSLPTANANHLGAIIAVGTGGVEDVVYICVLDATSAPVWATFQGPTGPTGPTGPAGVTPELRESGSYIQVSYDGGATWSNLVPLSDITGPAGPVGPAGIVAFPALPPIDGCVTFTIPVLAEGTILPFALPAGYSMTILSTEGRWVAQAGGGNYITNANGTDNLSESGFPIGALVYQSFQIDSHSEISATGPLELWSTAFTAGSTVWVQLSLNNLIGNFIGGYLLATIEVCGGTVPWTAFINFETTQAMFSVTGGQGTWTSGTGYSASHFNSGGTNYVQAKITGVFSAVPTLTDVQFAGNIALGVTSPAGNLSTYAQILLNSTPSVMGYFTLAQIVSGGYDFDWPNSSGEHVGLTPPQATISLEFAVCASANDSSDGGGSATITGVTIKGTGSVPSNLVPYLI